MNYVRDKDGYLQDITVYGSFEPSLDKDTKQWGKLAEQGLMETLGQHVCPDPYGKHGTC